MPDKAAESSEHVDPVMLSLFAARFMSVAEAMGRCLEQTAISVNIKLRLDFSCALFSPTGDLVANAPHLPVHLGSMSFAVRYQIARAKELGEPIEDGDVILANHPAAGGSHLPDITCITPVFGKKGEIIFFTASRGHHADIGGILPGSMPPTSKTLYEEGAQIKSFKLVRKGVYDREALVKLLCDDPAQYAGCSGSRCFRDVESDLHAQIAANRKGVQLIDLLVDEWGLETVQAYMLHIRNNAELAVRNLLREVAERQGSNELWARDYMDDGSPIELRVTIDPEKGSAIFDFEGTGPEVYGNTNCPRSVSHSAIIYCLRAMVSTEIPLNQGCLEPIEVRIPAGSLLDPSDDAAVVGGNVLTSQRVTDVVLKAFKAAAASQGDCNNLTFGRGGQTADGKHVEGFGYYETIAGGSGAGPTWHGTSGVHVAMTNTRITDPETLERNYPVLLRQFSLRPGSGGKGRFNGGNGVVREIEFLNKQIQVSILSERRSYRPFGMEGGGDAQSGRNTWVRHQGDEERKVNLGAKATALMGRLDRIIVETPGGGAWGAPGSEADDEPSKQERHHGARGSLADRAAEQLGA
ncbi:Hydantoinase B/oxoprolinase [Tilletiopsis washingtonensis]|uniref:Hydantoinase B/oxoprolinase n=1 Tax=Tilletiopsis washingtonensis TaxID=58919 RepID=A0A316ZFD0_9BASI|nr:Hydantoinase B/oxoprolinase [Tilletiopsis washingtonensis]PWO00451.1 Hydantoinase B/oxoprolinase [Tilletiopsis washingtonensis]